jgi:hypothetical protein
LFRRPLLSGIFFLAHKCSPDNMILVSYDV